MPRQHQIALSLTVDAPGPASNASEEVNSTIWLGIEKSTDYQNPDLPFSACSLVFNDLPDTIIARGASLDGLCTQTFSENCVADLQKQAADMAWDFTKNSSQAEPHKNGTFSRLPEICNFLADQMTLALPDSCRSFAEDNRLWETVDTLRKSIFIHCDPTNAKEAIALTGQETSGLTGCNVSIDNLYRDSAYKAFNTFPIHQSSVGPPGFNTSTNATGIDQLSRDSYYHRIMENVVPVMRIYMPTANENTSPDYIKIDSAQAEMSCLKASTGPGGGQNPAGLPSSKTSGSSTNIVPSVIGSAFAMLALSVISMSLYC